MIHLIHLCKKDLAFTKTWILGTWLVLAMSTILPWISMGSDASEPFMMIRLFAPALAVFLASTRIIHCDPFVGTSGFMGTRPLRATRLLGQKLIFIALVLVLPAVGFAVLHALSMRVQLSASDYLVLMIENCLFFSVISGVAILFAVISRNTGMMVVFILLSFLGLFLYSAFFGTLKTSFGTSLKEQHLRASLQLVAQTFLPITTVAIAMSWAARRRIWLTATVFLLSTGILVWIMNRWTWNFVDAMSKDATLEEIIAESPTIEWIDPPRFISNVSKQSIPYLQIVRTGRMIGLQDGWVGGLVKFQTEAKFVDGTVWKSKGDSELYPFSDGTETLLPQLGIQFPEDHEMRLYELAWIWTLFEFEKSRLQEKSEHRAQIRGIGTFQLYQPVVLAELPAQAGSTAVSGRFKYRINSLNAIEGKISVNLRIHGVALRMKGDSTRASLEPELLFVNRRTKQFTIASGSGGSSTTGIESGTIRKTWHNRDFSG